jgi:hypothetical protein
LRHVSNGRGGRFRGRCSKRSWRSSSDCGHRPRQHEREIGSNATGDHGRGARLAPRRKSTGWLDRLVRTTRAICHCSRRPKRQFWRPNCPESAECRIMCQSGSARAPRCGPGSAEPVKSS